MQGEDIPTLSSELPITIVIYDNIYTSRYVMNTQDIIDSLTEWIQSTVKPDLKRLMRTSPFYLHLSRQYVDEDPLVVLAACRAEVQRLFPGFKLDIKLRVNAGDKRLQYPPVWQTRGTESVFEPLEV